MISNTSCPINRESNVKFTEERKSEQPHAKQGSESICKEFIDEILENIHLACKNSQPTNTKASMQLIQDPQLTLQILSKRIDTQVTENLYSFKSITFFLCRIIITMDFHLDQLEKLRAHPLNGPPTIC